MQTITKTILPFAKLPQGHFISMSLDYAGNVLVLTTKNEPDFRNGGFSKITPDKPQTYQIWSTADAWSGEFYPYAEITASVNFHEVQRFANGDILLVCGRCQYRPNGKSDKNGFIYSADGQLKSQFLLGDGIENTQISKQGTIWTSYFDEGVLGNYGWNFGHTVGESGLVAWSADGKKTYDFQPIAGLDDIFDCYAMNVVSDSLTYCYYYTEFDLVEIKNHKITNYWHIPIAGSNAFMTYANQAVFVGGYDEKYEPNALYLITLGDDHEVQMNKKIVLKAEDSDDNILQNGERKSFVYARGNQMLVLQGNKLFYLPFAIFMG